MAYQNITAKLSPEDIQEIKAALQTIQKKLPFLITLSTLVNESLNLVHQSQILVDESLNLVHQFQIPTTLVTSYQSGARIF
jgi:hypothetical protein